MTKKKILRWLVVLRKKIHDPYSNYASYLTTLVPLPTMEAPYPAILVSIKSGEFKKTIRFNTIEAYKVIFSLEEDEEMRLTEALRKANAEADRIEADMKLIFERRRLAPDAKLVRSDTGEIIADAERILRGEAKDND